MSVRFSGSYKGVISNSRVSIPAKMIKKFSAEARNTVFVTMSYDSKQINLFPLDYWQKLMEKLENGNPIQRKAYTYYTINSEEQQIEEKTGRIRLKQELLDSLGIEKDVKIQGEGKYISICTPKRHDDRNNELKMVLQNEGNEMELL